MSTHLGSKKAFQSLRLSCIDSCLLDMHSDVFLMKEGILMAGFHAKCVGVLGDGCNGGKEPITVSCTKISFSPAMYGRV